MQIKPKDAPAPEAIVWDGTNEAELFDLVQRVAGLGVWSPLDPDPREMKPLHFVIHSEEPHLGLNIQRTVEVPLPEGKNGEKTETPVVVARVEEGNVLVFDLFATTPLFVMSPDEFAAFYEEG
jgi:hypothetical protein